MVVCKALHRLDPAHAGLDVRVVLLQGSGHKRDSVVYIRVYDVVEFQQ